MQTSTLIRLATPSRALPTIAALALTLAVPASFAGGPIYADWTGNGADSNWSNGSNWIGIGHLGGGRIRFETSFLTLPDQYDMDVVYDIADERFGLFEVNSPSANFASQDHNLTITGQPGTMLSTANSNVGIVLDYFAGNSRGFEVNLHLIDMVIDSSITILTDGAFDRTTVTLENSSLDVLGRSNTIPGILRVIEGSVIFDNFDNGWTLDITGNGQLEVSDLSSIEIPVNNPNYTLIDNTAFFFDEFNSPGDVEIASGFLILNTRDEDTASSTISGHISGSGGLAIRGNHTLRLIGANSFSGNIWIQGGALEAESGPALGPLARTMIFDNNGIFRPRATFNALMDMQFNGAGTIDTSLTQDSHLLREPWVGTGDFTKAGTGVLDLDLDATAYTGQFIVDAGTLRISDPNVFINQSQATINQDATLDLNTPAVTIEALRGNGTITGNSTSLTLIGNNASPFPEFSGQILTNPTIIKNTSSVQVISSDLSAFTGSWQINGSNLMLTGPNTWNGNTNIAAGSTLIIEGGGTFDDELIGGGSILHRGNNTLTFNPSNTGYQGRISVRDGAILDLQSSFIGRVKVNDEGTLTGNDVSLTEIEAESGGTVSPGGDQSASILTTQSLLLAHFSMLEMDIIDASSNDHIIALDSTINAQLSISLGAGYAPAFEDSFSIITSPSSLVGNFSNLGLNDRLITAGGEGSFVVTVDSAGGYVTLDGFVAGSIGPCNPADLAEPFSVLDFFDISAFLGFFGAQDSSADLNNDGLFDFFDISAFLQFYSGGCP